MKDFYYQNTILLYTEQEYEFFGTLLSVSDTIALLLSTGLKFVYYAIELDDTLIPTTNPGCRISFFIDGLKMLPSWILV